MLLYRQKPFQRLFKPFLGIKVSYDVYELGDGERGILDLFRPLRLRLMRWHLKGDAC